MPPCGANSRPAPSPSCSRTSRARRGCCTSSGRSPMRRRSRAPARASGGVPPTAGSRWTRRATRSSSPSRPLRRARGRAGMRRRSRPGRSRCESGCTPGRRSLTRGGLRRGRRAPGRAHRRRRARRTGARLRVDRACSSRSSSRDLGEHRLKDLSAPERIYQLGDGDFPPLKSLYRTNLPDHPTPSSAASASSAEVVGLLGGARAC